MAVTAKWSLKTQKYIELRQIYSFEIKFKMVAAKRTDHQYTGILQWEPTAKFPNNII